MALFPIMSLLKCCKSLKEFKQIHAYTLQRGKFADTFVATKMLEYCAMSAKNLDYCFRIFNTIQLPDSYTWTTMIRGYVEIKIPEKAVEYYHQMRLLGIQPNKFTFLFMLKAYSLKPNYGEGRIIHGKIIKIGVMSDIFFQTALINFYCKCGEFRSAFILFNECYCKNVVIWNTMLAGSFACGEIEAAEKLFNNMPERTVASWNAAISGYSKWGYIDVARSLFDAMPEKDLLSWTAMISGYSQSKKATEAISLFQKMLGVGVRPDGFTMVGVLSACSQVGALDVGKWVHAYVDKNKLRPDLVLDTALVDMYAKCGCIDTALRVFYFMAERNVFSWNAILCGLAMHGQGHEVLKLFRQMEFEHVQPNDITFVGVLSSCCHLGLVEEGRRQFGKMCKELKISPKIEHYGCMVDILGRAGLVDEAKELVRSMPMEPNVVVWGALLSACIIHGYINEAEQVVKQLLELAPGEGGYYVILSNICAVKRCWHEVSKLRKQMREMRLTKNPGCSSVEVNSMVHQFYVNDKKHPYREEISKTLDRLNSNLEDEGYVPKPTLCLYNMDEFFVC